MVENWVYKESLQRGALATHKYCEKMGGAVLGTNRERGEMTLERMLGPRLQTPKEVSYPPIDPLHLSG
jgi:hypothetical protein